MRVGVARCRTVDGVCLVCLVIGVRNLIERKIHDTANLIVLQ